MLVRIMYIMLNAPEQLIYSSDNQHDIFRRHPGRYDTDNTLENLTVKAATGEKQWPVSTAFA